MSNLQWGKVRTEQNLYVSNREEWRAWLRKNHTRAKEVWLIFHKKHTDKPSIPYDDAVEEALCFGWIDSTIRRVDEERYAQRFTPRSRRSKWSRLNIGRATKMIRERRMTEAGLSKFNTARKTSREEVTKNAAKRLVIPSDFRKALKAKRDAWENFRAFAPGYRKLYIRWIQDAKRDETRKRRIDQAVKWALEKKKPGMM